MPNQDQGNANLPEKPQGQSESDPKTPHVKIQKTTEIHSETYIGPLPHPNLLRQFDEIVPGSAERIINMAENQSAHRIFLERTVVVGDNKRADKGLWIGASIAAIVLAGSITCILTGHDWAGAALGAIDIGSIVYIFVHTNRTRQDERVQKSKSMKSIRPELPAPKEQEQQSV